MKIKITREDLVKSIQICYFDGGPYGSDAGWHDTNMKNCPISNSLIREGVKKAKTDSNIIDVFGKVYRSEEHRNFVKKFDKLMCDAGP